MKLFIDVETEISATVTLKKQTLRRYLRDAAILGCAYAVDDEEPVWVSAESPAWLSFTTWLTQMANDPEVIFVAFNAAFDIRALRFGWTRRHGPINMPQPIRVQCALEQAYGAWPNQPGAADFSSGVEHRDPHAYSLKSLAQTLALGLPKLDMRTDDLGEYCIRDVELARLVHKRAIARLHPYEIQVAELAQKVRELYLKIDGAKVTSAISAFDAAIKTNANDALVLLGENGADVFGLDTATGSVKSVKPHKLRKLLLENMGFDTPTTSHKKINPHKLAMAPRAAAALKATGETNKSLSHRRRVSGFAGVSEVDLELGYARAHTFRYSSPSIGKGVNLHNLPKRNKTLAKAVRSMYWLPDGYCWVRGDLSNTEYRGTGWLTDCTHTERLFSKDPFADPYIAFWIAATGQIITKEKNPAQRQVSKNAVLGLSFLMALERWTHELMIALADPANKLTVADFQVIADEQGWTLDRYGRSVMAKSHAPEAVVRVAQGTHEAFHRVHPEYKRYAQWLERAVTQASRALDPQAALHFAYGEAGAPNPDKCELIWENTPDLERSVRVRCGNWPAPTVTWRDIGVRPVGFDGGMAMSSRQAGSKGFRVLTKNILIENVVQATARNALVLGKLELQKLGWEYLLSVHDEILIACPMDKHEILRAFGDMVQVFGPGNTLGYGAAVLINPAEINVSRSLYETELGPAWWNRFATSGDPDTMLAALS